MNFFKNLKKKIDNKKAVICIVGVGYVGKGLLREFSHKGYKTIGLDINLNNLKKKKIIKEYNINE